MPDRNYEYAFVLPIYSDKSDFVCLCHVLYRPFDASLRAALPVTMLTFRPFIFMAIGVFGARLPIS